MEVYEVPSPGNSLDDNPLHPLNISSWADNSINLGSYCSLIVWARTDFLFAHELIYVD